MLFVDSPEIVASWWSMNLGEGSILEHDGEFFYFLFNTIEFGFHPADDDRNTRGGSPVIYLSVANLEQTRTRLAALGCSLHRGPLTITPTRQICQMIDPFGNTFGLDGS